MARTPSSVPDDLRHYNLPIGTLGLVNQMLHFYILMIVICGRRPLCPSRKIRHVNYTTWLYSTLIICVIGFGIDSASHLNHWELITSVVGNTVLFIVFIGMSIGGARGVMKPAVTGPQADAVGTTQSIAVNEQRVPHHSEDLEKGKRATEPEAHSADFSKTYTPDLEVVGVPENPANRIPTKRSSETDAISTSPTVQEDGISTSAPEDIPDPQTPAKNMDTDTGAVLYMLMFNMPGTSLVFIGLVGQLARNLPSDWRSIGQIRSVVITFSIFLAANVVGPLLSILCGTSRRRQTDDEAAPNKKWNYKDSIMLGIIFLSFFVVSFDKFLLAALSDDINGANHILSHGRVPLAYLIVTNLLPALAL